MGPTPEITSRITTVETELSTARTQLTTAETAITELTSKLSTPGTTAAPTTIPDTCVELMEKKDEDINRVQEKYNTALQKLLFIKNNCPDLNEVCPAVTTTPSFIR